MYDYLNIILNIIDIFDAENPALKDADIPEPMDNWSIEDFRDFIPGER